MDFFDRDMGQRWLADFIANELTIITLGMTLTYAPIQQRTEEPETGVHEVIMNNRIIRLSESYADLWQQAEEYFTRAYRRTLPSSQEK